MRLPRKKGRTWTQEQLDIFKGLGKGSEHMFVHALAGTGKSTTMTEGLNRDKLSPLRGRRRAMMVFGKANAEELKTMVPSDVKAGTIHSLMYGVIRNQIELPPGRRAVNDQRDRILLDEILNGRRLVRGARWAIMKLAGLAMNHGITPAEVANPAGFLREIIIRHGVSSKLPEVELIDYTNQLLRLSADTRSIRQTGITFDQMIWLPYYLQLAPATRYHQLIVDEAQDLNVVQQYDALLMGERIAVVGDTWQAIYGFRGADTDALGSLEQKLGSMRHYPLTICWRCPREVIALAQRLVPEIRARPDAPDGEVLEVSPDSIIEELVPGKSMVLCRTNAPLVHMIFRLWAREIRAYIQGRRFGLDLLEMVEAEEYSGISINELLGRIHDRARRDEARLLDFPNSEGQIALLHDKVDCLQCLADNASTANPTGAVQELKDRLNFLFTDVEQADKVRLSTIHRAKGLEALDVYIIEPHLLPHPMAEQPWEQEQERNLLYVSVTRAKQRLIFAGSMPRMLTGNSDEG